jgi:chromosome segregation ATPase
MRYSYDRTAASTAAFDRALNDIGVLRENLKAFESAIKEASKSYEGPQRGDAKAEKQAEKLSRELDKLDQKMEKLKQTMFRLYDAITGPA